MTKTTSMPHLTLQKCISVHDLANLLGFPSYKELSQLIYPHTNSLYRSYLVPKKNGNSRLIEAPKNKLKKIQRIILKELDEIYRPKNSTHGFIKGRSIVTNARAHTNKKFILNIDLNDFFTTIHYGRVKKLLSSYPLKLPNDVATVVAHICCFNNHLPQGAPTSPILSNMICYRLDNEMQVLASKNRCSYTRYVDDITISFTQNQGKIPRDILVYSKNKTIKIGNTLLKTITDNGFTINNNKTRVTGRDQKQLVTGLVTNEKANIDRKFIRKTNSIINAIIKYGFENAELDYFTKYQTKGYIRDYYQLKKEAEGELLKKIINGRVNHIKNVRGSHDQVYKKIAYQLSIAFGKPDLGILKSKLDEVSDSIFVIENSLDPAQGTGFLLDGYGLITNQHVANCIDKDFTELLDIFRHDDIENKRKVNFLWSDAKIDLALFKPTSDFAGIPNLVIGDDSKIGIGSKVIILGFPSWSKGDGPSINDGKIIQTKKYFGEPRYIVDIPIIHGNSGGPVLNANYEVIGVATNGSKDHDYSTSFHGFIPISILVEKHKST